MSPFNPFLAVYSKTQIKDNLVSKVHIRPGIEVKSPLRVVLRVGADLQRIARPSGAVHGG
ncbi:MAG: hypothetical protein KF856_06030 [Cyclobacteriaceae bacterium]|nr:hypothetical protein [Cyclobacteriaceae bacterium]